MATTANMHIRPAQISDEPALVRICARAFFDEDLFGRVIHPHRAQYPDDTAIFWRDVLRSDWMNARNRVIVAVKSDGSGAEEIVGLAIWQRQGTDAGADKVRAAWTSPGEFPPVEEKPNRALDPTRRNILDRAMPFCADLWAGDRAQTWYLALCCVDPDVSGRGAGRALVEWGLSKARAEGVCASVTSSEGNEAFYLKCGFDEVVGNACAGEGNPLGELNTTGGEILFMWPQSGRI